MPFITSGSRRTRGLAAAIVSLGLLTAAPAAQAATAANPLNCTPEPSLKQPFTPWGDFGQYTLSPAGDFESGLRTWYTSGKGVSIVSENEPYKVGNSTDSHSLSLGPNAWAVSQPICIDDTYPWFRLFARNTGASTGKLVVEVLYLDTNLQLQLQGSGVWTDATSSWAPTSTMKIGMTFDSTVANGAAPVAFRFTSKGKGSSWRIDDVYVDPMARR